MLLLGVMGVHFAQEVAPLLVGGGLYYRLRPEAEVRFTADFYFAHSALNVRNPPEGTPIVQVGLSTYEVEDANEVFGSIYRAKEAALQRASALFPRTAPVRPAGSASPTIVVRTVVHEVVKVPCRYCGSLVEITARACATCGAPLR